jgi:hypothetical protein
MAAANASLSARRGVKDSKDQESRIHVGDGPSCDAGYDQSDDTGGGEQLLHLAHLILLD